MSKPMQIVMMSLVALIGALIANNISFDSILKLTKNNESLVKLVESHNLLECGNDDVKKLTMKILEEQMKNGMKLMYKLDDDEINRRYAEVAPKLINIRTKSIDNEIRQTECVANVDYGQIKAPIYYRASITSDEELYIEILKM